MPGGWNHTRRPAPDRPVRLQRPSAKIRKQKTWSGVRVTNGWPKRSGMASQRMVNQAIPASGISSGGIAHRTHRGRAACAPMVLQSRELIFVNYPALRGRLVRHHSKSHADTALPAPDRYRRHTRGDTPRDGGRESDRPSAGSRECPAGARGRIGRRAHDGACQPLRTLQFGGAAPGLYILQVTRAPFVTAYYGQKRWNSAGMPLAVTDSETQFVTVRMMRFAAIGGTVVDENDVGQPGIEVSAYRNLRPLQLIAHATADERGVYVSMAFCPAVTWCGAWAKRSKARVLSPLSLMKRSQ